jgi:hypothetical protein
MKNLTIMLEFLKKLGGKGAEFFQEIGATN